MGDAELERARRDLARCKLDLLEAETEKNIYRKRVMEMVEEIAKLRLQFDQAAARARSEMLDGDQ